MEVKRLLCLGDKGKWASEMNEVLEKKVWDRLIVDERGLPMVQFNGVRGLKNTSLGYGRNPE